MPKVSEFFGISIYVYFDDHAPPHFHARYAGAEAVIRIDDGRVLRGDLPPRAMGLVAEWAARHRQELRQVWRQAVAKETLSSIEPLE